MLCLVIHGSGSFLAAQISDSIPGLQLSADALRGNLTFPGEEILLNLGYQPTGPLPSTVKFGLKLPPGVTYGGNDWTPEGDSLTTVAILSDATAFTISIPLQIDATVTSPQLPFSASATVTGNGHTAHLYLLTARKLSETQDTCLTLADTSLNFAQTLVSTRKRILAELPAPIDLSPTGPVRISAKNCSVFKLNASPLDGLKGKKKDKCSCLKFTFAGPEANNLPARYDPGKKPLKGCRELISGSKKGDTIQVTIRTIDQAPLRRIVLTDGAGEILEASYESGALIFETVLESDTFSLHLYLQAKRKYIFFPEKKYAFLEVLRKSTKMEVFRGNAPVAVAPDTVTLFRSLGLVTDTLRIWKSTVVTTGPEASIFHRIAISERPRFDTLDAHQLSLDSNWISHGPIDSLGRDTCLGQFSVTSTAQAVATTGWDPIDTLFFQVSDTSGTVVGLRNPLGKRMGSIDLSIPMRLNTADPPARDRLMGIAYWIGVGTPSITAYAALGEEVPPEWAQPGVTAPLAAFAQGFPVVLPKLSPEYKLFREQFVRYAFTDERGRRNFSKDQGIPVLVAINPNRPNFGVVTGPELDQLIGRLNPGGKQDQLSLNLSFINQHQINTYRIKLYLIAWYRVETPVTKWEVQRP
ncbi:hypothetical protein [Lewinella sp. W8]|uniref:hypothetical protein n=1 Tax=Lewinella sp. W8 TaxID=2528208 RepID=UPI0010686E90|nr:hypothetical protein [Lewinella sp. W8]MTB52956.1 hypothetical protein [Lewinella sp. W8]